MIVKGYASTPHMDSYRHVVKLGAFDQSIKNRGIGGPKGVKLLWQHNNEKLIGRVLKLEGRNGGLWMEAEISEAISWGNDAAEVIKANKGLSFSIGYWIVDAELEEDAQGREYLLLTKLELGEISVVTRPANDECMIEEYA